MNDVQEFDGYISAIISEFFSGSFIETEFFPPSSYNWYQVDY